MKKRNDELIMAKALVRLVKGDLVGDFSGWEDGNGVDISRMLNAGLRAARRVLKKDSR